MLDGIDYIDRAEAKLPTTPQHLDTNGTDPLMPQDGIAYQTLTFKFRLRDKHAAELNRQARAVNFVWNYCNETQQKAAKSRRKWLSKYDLQKLTAGSSKELNLHAHTIQQVCWTYARSRDTHRRPWLRFRGRKSLGWVPFNQGHVTVVGQTLKFRGVIYQPMHWRDIPEGSKIGAGSFNQDAKGHWYINLPVQVPMQDTAPQSAVGIDLGLKDLATLSDGTKVENHRHYRRLEEKLGKAQRANKKKQARNIHAKIKNARKDQLHKVSAAIAKSHDLIVVGDVSASKMARTKMAKSVLDAGWSDLKNMLTYKAIRHGGVMLEVNERLTTQTCSECGSLPPERPRGIAGLGIREWACSDCGTRHDRDTNAAKNILRIGRDTLAEGATA